MSQTNSTLSSFGVEAHTPAPAAVASAAALTEPRDNDDLPSFGTPDEEYNLTTVRPQKSIHLSGSCPSAERHQVRWITGGDLTEYVEQHHDSSVLRIPETYDGFDITPIVQKVDSTTPGKNTYGWGISGQSLEQAFRALSGGGRYSASKYKFVPCGEYPWVLIGPEGTLLCSLVPVGRRGGEENRTSTAINWSHSPSGHSVDVEEENQSVLLGIKRLGLLLKQLDKEIVSHTCPAAVRVGGEHKFETADESEYKISTNTLVQLADLTDEPDQVVGQANVVLTTPTGAEVTIDNGWGGPSHEVFDVIDGEILAGFRWEWDNPDQSPEQVGGVAKYWLVSDYSGFTLHREFDRVITLPADDHTQVSPED